MHKQVLNYVSLAIILHIITIKLINWKSITNGKTRENLGIIVFISFVID